MWKRFLLLFFVFGLSASCFGASVNWNASIVDAEHGAPDGYRVYYGYTADQLTTAYDVGTELNFPIPETWNPATYYFGVRAYNQSGESGWATTPEGQTWVSYVKAEPPPVLPPEPATDVRIVFEQIEETLPMAVSQVGSATIATAIESSTVTSGSRTLGTGSNRLLVACVTYYNWAHTTTYVESINYDANSGAGNDKAFTKLGTVGVAGGNADFRTEIWYAVAPESGGTGHFDLAFSGVGYDATTVLIITEWTGADQTTPLNGLQGEGAHAEEAPSLTVSSAEGDVVIDCLAASGAITLGADQTSIYNGTPDTYYHACSIQAGASSVVMSWGNIVYHGHSAANIRAASGGGSSAVPKIMLLQDHFSGGIH